MRDTDVPRTEKMRAALAAFAGWLPAGPAGDGEGFEDLCVRRPDLSAELRELRSVFQLGHAALTSRSFQAALRDTFGDLAELTVELEDGSAPSAGAERTASVRAGATGTALPGSRYAIEDEIARGGMGTIWRVRDRDLRRTLAMKVMSIAPGDSSVGEPPSRADLARFVEEAQVTAQLDHPGIVPVHEIGFDPEGRPFFTMKLVKGRDLDDVLRLARAGEERWSLPRVVGVLVKACQALAYAHSKGVIHRDLKPSNIRVGRFGEVYLMDWGLAKIVGRRDLHDIRPRDSELTATLRSPRRGVDGGGPDSALVTMDGSVVGTPAYMPPEQARGQAEEVDQASDIYSLGAILYNLLTEQAPYVEPGARLSAHTILARVLDGPPRRVHLLNPQAPPELIAICEKAMAREKRDRYGSSLDLAEDLQAFLDHRVVRAYRTGAVAEFRSWVSRNRTTAGVAAGTVLLLMGIFIFGAFWERAKALRLRESLTRQYLRRGQALCEGDRMATGLHWLARSLEEAPPQRPALRETIEQNLAGWARQWPVPRAVLLQDSLVFSAALAPDGQRAVTGNHNGVVRSWSTETGEDLGAIAKVDRGVMDIRISPDGRRLSTIDEDAGARLWDARTGEAVPLAIAGISRAAFSPDSERLATGAKDGTVRFWDARTGEALGAPSVHDGTVNSLEFSRDGRRVLTASEDGTARLWDGRTCGAGAILYHPLPVWNAVFSLDGGRIATACADNKVRLWSSDSGQALGVPMMHERVQHLAFSPVDGKRLLTGGADRAARLWDAFTGEPLGAPMLHEKRVTAVLFAGEERILTGSWDGTVRLWSEETGEPIAVIARYENYVHAVHLGPDRRTVLVRSGGHAPGIWEIPPEALRGRGPGLPITGRSVAWAPDGRLVVSDKARGWRWAVESAAPTPTTEGAQEDDAYFVAVSPDGRHVLSGGKDETARLGSLEGAGLPWRSLAHDREVRAGAFSRDGKLVATGSFDGMARLWSVEAGQLVRPPIDHGNTVEDVDFSGDGRLLATACGDGKARMWSVETGRRVGVDMKHGGAVLAVSFAPGGDRVVTGSRDGTARFWWAPSGQPTGLILNHEGWVEDVCFSRDGKRVATVADVVRIWSSETGEPLGPPLEQSAGMWEIAFSPDGARLAGASRVAPGRVWDTAPPIQGDLRRSRLWVEVLTWQEMDRNGVLTWLDRPTWEARRAELETLGGPPGR